MASAYDDAMAALKQGGLLEKPKDSGTPQESEGEDTDPWWKRAWKGAEKGLAGQAVGGAEAIAGLTGGDVSEIPGEKWVNEPSRSKWETAGNVFGSVLPWMLLPEVGAASTLGRIMEGIGKGALIGAYQPTGGDPEQHIGGALAGGMGGGTTAVPGLVGSAATALAHKVSPGVGYAVHSMLSNLAPSDLGRLARAAAAIGGADISSGAVPWPPQLPSRPYVAGTPEAPGRGAPNRDLGVAGAPGAPGMGAPSRGLDNPFGITEEDVADPPM